MYIGFTIYRSLGVLRTPVDAMRVVVAVVELQRDGSAKLGYRHNDGLARVHIDKFE
jgi:hypothetical protein